MAGHDLLTDPQGVKRSISLTGQFAAVDDMLTGRENLEMMAGLRRLGRREARTRTDQLLEEFDLVAAAERRVSTYSGGMVRRLDLAISVITPPAVLFLDEPTTGLDPRSRERLWGTVRGLAATGTTILLTTQYLDEADQLADRIALLDQRTHRRGRHGGRAEEGPGHGGRPARVRRRDRFEQATAELAATRADERTCAVEVPSDGTPTQLVELLCRLDRLGCPPERVSTREPSLDEVFMSLTSPTGLVSKELSR